MRPLTCFVLAAAAALPALMPAARAQQSPQEIRGEMLLSRHCAMCHATGQAGTSPHRLAPPFRTLAQRYALESLEEALAEGLLSGHPDMPEFAFPPRDVGAIIRYLRSIQEK
jgi:mono/diheme cytochrome c family protein